MSDWFKNFHFDWRTSLFTLSSASIVVFLIKIIKRHIKEWTAYLIEGVMYALSKYVKHSLAGALSLKRYSRIQLAVEKFKYLHVPSSFDIKLNIDEMFVTLSLKNHKEEVSNFTHNNFLTLGNRIKVMGDPGSGKSSLVKRVFRDHCLKGMKNAKKSKLPVLIELKNVTPPDGTVNDWGRWFFEYIREEVAKVDAYKMSACFDNYAATSGLLVLLDGLDEVSSLNYCVIEKAINGLSDCLNELSADNVVVLTMRTQFYQQIKKDYLANFPHSTFLNPFTPSDIYEFLRKWHFKKEAESNISRIYKNLTDKPTLREMCSNPLILSMYVAEDIASGGILSPTSRTEFYKKVTDELMFNRRWFQKNTTESSHVTIKEKRERILGKIAYDHIIDFTQPANNLSWESAIAVIKNVLKCDDEKANDVFNEISRETGLITEERKKESFRFIHLTFCEFLAAYETVQGTENGWQDVVEVHVTYCKRNNENSPRLLEVIPFTAGLLPRIKKSEFLEEVERLDDYALMTRCFLETKLYEHPCWNRFIVKARKKFLHVAGNKLEEKWLFDLHLFNVVVKDAELSAQHLPAFTPVDLSMFYKNLLENQKDGLHKILAAYARQDAAAVFRLSEICNFNLVHDFPQIIVENCDQAPFLGLVREQIIQSSEFDKWAALVAESALWKEAVYTLVNNMPPVDILRERIKQNKEYRFWYYKKYVKETLFTQCLTLGSLHLKSNLPALEALMDFKSPYENRIWVLLSRIFLYGLIILFYFPMLLLFFFPPGIYTKVYIWILGIMLGMSLFMTPIIFTNIKRVKWLIISNFYQFLFTNLVNLLLEGKITSQTLIFRIHLKRQLRKEKRKKIIWQ